MADTEQRAPFGAYGESRPVDLSTWPDAWLVEAVQSASQRHFGKPAMFKGLGGSIPFMAMLGERFPQAQFFITGTGGPGSNAHGPNEFLHVPYAERLTCCVADVIAAHYLAQQGPR